MPEQAAALIKDDPQKVLPTLVLEQDAVRRCRCCSSARCCRPSSPPRRPRCWRPRSPSSRTSGASSCPRQSDKQELRTMRITVLVFTVCVLRLRDRAAGHADLRHGVGRLPGHAGRRLRAAGVAACTGSAPPRRARSSRSCWASSPGCCSWPRRPGQSFPAQLAGFLMAWVGMVVGSLGPQAVTQPARHAPPHRRRARLSRAAGDRAAAVR